MRDNTGQPSQPSVGNVVMFAAATVGWLILFLVTLATSTPGATFWIKAVFSGGFMIMSAVATVLLWRRVARNKNVEGNG